LWLTSRFDLEEADTYDTRPMSADDSKLRDVSVLADEGAVVPVDIPVRDLARLLPELAADSGVARGEVSFTRDHHEPAADVTVEATLTLICQRCMRPMQQLVTTSSRVCMLVDETAAARLPMDVETMLAPEGRLRIADIVAEELLLALPLAPRHEDEADCGAEFASLGDNAAADEPPRLPFAGLAELMNRDAGPGDISAERPIKAPRTRR
jgi:uncharacterized protein